MLKAKSTVSKVLTQLSSQLEPITGKRESKFEAEILLSEFLVKSRTWLKTWPEYDLSSSQLERLSELLNRRLTGEPLAYIVGTQEFWSLNLKVNQATLIPRPETELLVETALEKIPHDRVYNVADLGTGSGAIALAIATERPQATVFAVDFSIEAIEVAEYNRVNLGLDNVKTIKNSWLDNWSEGTLDLIVANPPYVAADDPHLQDLTYEPYSALVAEDDGYADMVTIATQAQSVLTKDGLLMFEHGYQQAGNVRSILSKLGYQAIRTIQDLSGNDRVTIARFIE